MVLHRRTSGWALVAACLWLAPGRADKDAPEFGTWLGKNSEGEATTMTFQPGGRLVIKIASFERTCTYRVDWSAKPAALDVTFEADGKKHQIETIVELQKDGSLRFQDQMPGKKRPTAFDKRSFTLRKS